jgi:hypothetical protein
VSGAIPGSRAAEAGGSRDGDRIQSRTPMWVVVQHFEQSMDMKIERGVEILSISYWPRARYKVECWENSIAPNFRSFMVTINYF